MEGLRQAMEKGRQEALANFIQGEELVIAMHQWLFVGGPNMNAHLSRLYTATGIDQFVEEALGRLWDMPMNEEARHVTSLRMAGFRGIDPVLSLAG